MSFPSVGRAELITVYPGDYYLGEFDFAPSAGPLTDTYLTFSAAATTDISWELYDANGTLTGSGTLASLGADLQGYSTASDTISSPTGAGFIVLASADTFTTDTPYVTATLPDGTIETVLDGGKKYNKERKKNYNPRDDFCTYNPFDSKCGYTSSKSPDCSPVPIPASFPLLGSAIALIGLLSWSRKRVGHHTLLSSRA